jgi:hypothetical protein
LLLEAIMRIFGIGFAAAFFTFGANAQDMPQDVSRQAVALPNGRCMVSAITPKTVGGTIVIPFGMTFTTAPIVTVSSVWIGGRGVGATETVTAISTDQFSDSSAAFAGDYFVSWIAIGPALKRVCK